MGLFTFNVYNDNSKVLKEIRELKNIIIMAKEEIAAAVAEIKDAAANIAADIERLAEQAEGGLTPEEATDLAAELRTVGQSLRAVADKNPEPEA